MITTRQSNRPKPEPESKPEEKKKLLTTRDVGLKPREEIDPKKVKDTKSLDMSKALKPGWGRKDE